MSQAYPVLFVSHGAPTFAIEPGKAGARLTEVGRALPRPTAIVIVSPHWMTRGGVRVGSSQTPETIHDFGGFPEALYRLQYPAPGNPALAEQINSLLNSAGISASTESNRGLDHGAWVPLLYLMPDADIPVVQVSMPYPLTPVDAWQLGQALKPLREQGILIIGSGSLTHNLYEFRGYDGDPAEYVKNFADWFSQALRAADMPALFDYRRNAPDAERAHPSDEHLMPLFLALGAAGEHYEMEVLEGGIAHGVLAMDSYLFRTPSTLSLTQEGTQV
ncbi:dioxygenase [Stutzerimonas zhaodongensis]|uniref:Dioxygenase n=1 Tax=Stutzerimonas zhaodongensis TaxID=1176257 RepID=A0A365PQ80_9GAMM|nr:class III extradiol ring-cleavage dioxygenase [Stutzerimonas zhaodongensis]RBA52181.1 dioxygenase [Stutzerimonas zhaodongensis]